MKKLLSVLMVLVLLFAACSKPEEPISEQPETNEPGSNGPSKPISSEEENLLPGGINPKDYDEVEEYEGAFVLSNRTDENCTKAVFSSADGGMVFDHHLEERPADEIWFLSSNGEIVNNEPYQYYDWLIGYLAGFRNGAIEVFEITENGLEFYFSESPETKEYFGYKVTSYRWFGSTPCYGVIAPDGSVFAEPNYEIVDIPFEDRILLFDGSIQSWYFTRCNILDPEGNIINNSYNHVEYFVCDEGYIGIAFCGNKEDDPEHRQTFDLNGNPMPSGFWFVDKNGTPVSEMYNHFYVGEEWNWNLSKASRNDIIHVTAADGESHSFTVESILIKE